MSNKAFIQELLQLIIELFLTPLMLVNWYDAMEMGAVLKGFVPKSILAGSLSITHLILIWMLHISIYQLAFII